MGSNNHDAVYSAVEYLLSLGHQRLAFLFERPEISSESERYAGYVDAMRDCGLGNFVTKAHSVSELDVWMKDFIKEGNMAMICANDYTASIVIKELKAVGLEVPRDISVVGFDDSDTYRYHSPALTTLRQDYYAIGYEAARVLDKLMEGTTKGYTKMYLPAHLIVRDSTGKNIGREFNCVESRNEE